MNERKHPPEWQTLTQHTVYENPWIEVSHREVIAPTGAPSIYGLVHFRKTAIGIVPIDKDAHTWLVGQQRYTLGEWSWEIPEGGGDPGESVLNGAQRELHEETGLTASVWTPLLKVHTSNSVTDEVGYGFVATGLTQHAVEQHDQTEALVLKRLPFEHAFQMAMDGEITDALALACIFKVQRWLETGQLKLNTSSSAAKS